MINFARSNFGPVSEAFINKQYFDFTAACGYIQTVPYARLFEKENLLAVILENRGTCSTKNAFLKVLLKEQLVVFSWRA